MHRFYQEQYQLDGGKQDRYVTGSDAIGPDDGRLRHEGAADLQVPARASTIRDYAIDDNFFQAAFGGSFLNHQWLIAAASPVDPNGAPGGANATSTPVLDANGMPSNEPLYTSTLLGADAAGPAADGDVRPGRDAAAAAQPARVRQLRASTRCSRPSSRLAGHRSARQLPAQTNADDRRPADGGGRRLGVVLGRLVERERRHRTARAGRTARPRRRRRPAAATRTSTAGRPAHTGRAARTTCSSTTTSRSTTSPNYATRARRGRAAHLQDEVEFMQLARRRPTKDCNLKPVSFVKPIGDGERASRATRASRTAATTSSTLLQSIEGSTCAKDTMVIVTYDEFGGQWDHVSPPGQGNDNGPHDVWGPGTRIPALVLAPHLKATSSSTARSTTRRRSSRRSSTATGSPRSAPATRR